MAGERETTRDRARRRDREAGAVSPGEPSDRIEEEGSTAATRAEAERRDGTDRRLIEEAVADERRREQRRADDRARAQRRAAIFGRITQGVDYAFYLLYGLLGIRFVLALLGAAETAGFVRFINGLTQPFYGPFSGIVARPAVNGGVLDFPLIIALLAYLLLHVAIRGLIKVVAGERRRP